MTGYLKEAQKLHELAICLENISGDDRRDLSDYSREEIVSEAKYILSCFYEAGHSFNEDLGSEDKETRATAHKEVAGLKRFIKKYS